MGFLNRFTRTEDGAEDNPGEARRVEDCSNEAGEPDGGKAPRIEGDAPANGEPPAPSGGDVVIEARDLHYEYPDGTVGLDGVDVTLRAGERVAVVGPNGAGKSTLQLVLGGLIEATAGSVTYFGDVTGPDVVRERLGVLLQDPDDYLFNTTVREDIEYGPAQLGLPAEQTDARIDQLAEALSLGGLLDRPPFLLSGGEKQRAALASVLSFDPDVLLLDEPTSAVDGAQRDQILRLLDSQHGQGKAVVTFVPDLELVPRIADRVVLVEPDGTIGARGSVRSVLTDATLLADNDLEPPPMVRLFDGVADEVPLTVQEGRAWLTDELE